MHLARLACSLLLLLAMSAALEAASVPLDREYPLEATLVTKANAAKLQSLLNDNLVVRLEANQDFAPTNNGSVGPFSNPITLTTGMRLYGVGNRVPNITIAAGATDVVISHVVQGSIIFAAGAPSQITKRCFLRGVHFCEIKTTGGRLEDNLIIDAYNTVVTFNCANSGFLRNNRLIRHQSQGGEYEILMRGNAADPSYGNVLLGTSALTIDYPPGYSTSNLNGYFQARIELEGLRDATIIGSSAESGNGTSVPLMRVLGAEDLKLFQTASAFYGKHTLDTDAASVWLHSALLSANDGTNGGAGGTFPTFLIRPQTERLVRSYLYAAHTIGDTNASAAPLRANLFDESAADDVSSGTPRHAAKLVQINATRPTGVIPSAQAAAILATVSNRTASPWERPSFATPPGPFNGPATNPKTRAQIQTELDTTGVCYLDPGIYDIDQSIKLGWIWTNTTTKKGFYRTLIGSGKGNTVLRATNNTIDLIVEGQTAFNDPPANSTAIGGTEQIRLMDLTLQGGRWGIRLEAGNNTSDDTRLSIQYTDNLLSHICIRDMAAGGLLFTNVYGWDNCSSHALDFVNCPVGLQQIGAGGTDLGKNLAYMDKCLFYGCQWINCTIGVDLSAGRASGGNPFVNCLFKGNTTRAFQCNHSPTLFANCDFIDNGGRPTVLVTGDASFISCRWDAQNVDATDFVDGTLLNFDGCTFRADGGKNVVVTRNITDDSEAPWINFTNQFNRGSYVNRNVHFFNCTLGVPVGQWLNGIAINTDFRATADAASRGRVVWSEVKIPGNTASFPIALSNINRTILVEGQASPRPQLLVGSLFPVSLSSGITSSAPTISSALGNQTLSIGVAMTPLAIPTANGTPTIFDSTPLPPGISLNRTTGVISGTPTRAGSYAVSLYAANEFGAGPTAITFLVLGQPTGAPALGSISNPITGSVGIPLTVDVAASGATSYDIDILPPGLSLDATTGMIRGTPTAASTLTAVLRATGTGGTSAAQLNFVIATVPPVFIAVADPITGTVGAPLTVNVSASSTVSYAVDTLPTGLVLAGGGIISGTPTSAGDVTTNVSATGVGGTTTKTIHFSIAAATATSPATDRTNSCPGGGIGVIFSLLTLGFLVRQRR